MVSERIEDHEGETFDLVRGGAFTYRVVGGHVVPDRTPQQIPRSRAGVVYRVLGSDRYGLDANNDGRGCE